MLLLLAALALAVGVLVALFVVEPGGTVGEAVARGGSPYRVPLLWRVHAASGLLVVPQFTISAFSYLFMVEQLHWSPGAAGGILAAGQLAGAAGRLAAGYG